MHDVRRTLGRTPQAETAAQPGVHLLDQAISATKQTERTRAEDLMKHADRAGAQGHGHLVQERHQTINDAIKAIDAKISKQLAAVMHHPNSRSWRAPGAA